MSDGETAGAMESEVRRLEAAREISNLMGRFSFLETAGRIDAVVGLFAGDGRAARIEVAGGDIWSGREQVRRFFSRYEERGRAGLLIVHAMTSPRIDVSADGRTAQGRWSSPGNETVPATGGVPEALWVWQEYVVDFVRSDGWRIASMTIHPIVKTPPMHNWASDNRLLGGSDLTTGRGTGHRSPLDSAYRTDAPPAAIASRRGGQ